MVRTHEPTNKKKGTKKTILVLVAFSDFMTLKIIPCYHNNNIISNSNIIKELSTSKAKTTNHYHQYPSS